MTLPWMKMWIEALDDPKLTRLSLAERGAWWGILKIAWKSGAGGKIISGGVGLDMDEIADALHIKNTMDRQALESMVVEMEARHSLMWNDNHVLTVVNLDKRQSIPPSSQPEAIAERVRRYRERQKQMQGGEEEHKLLPEAGEGEEVPLMTSLDEAVLAVWSGIKGFPRDSKDATGFLNKLREEFPDVDILEESKNWAAAKLSTPLAKRSMPFKQMRAWMMKARQFAQERSDKEGEQQRKGVRAKPTQGRRRTITRISGN